MLPSHSPGFSNIVAQAHHLCVPLEYGTLLKLGTRSCLGVKKWPATSKKIFCQWVRMAKIITLTPLRSTPWRWCDDVNAIAIKALFLLCTSPPSTALVGRVERVGGDDHVNILRGVDDIDKVQPHLPHTTINLLSRRWWQSGGEEVASGGETMDGKDGQRTMDNGPWTMDNGQCIMDDGRWMTDVGWWMMDTDVCGNWVEEYCLANTMNGKTTNAIIN